MTEGIADVMSECAHGKRQLVGRMRIAKQCHDKVAAANVVSEIGKELVAEGIVPDVLDSAAAVSIGSGDFELRSGKPGIAAQQQRNNRIVPGQIDQLFMRKKRVSLRRLPTSGNSDQQERESSHPLQAC